MAKITLITGQPGAGKSLLAITKGLEYMREGRQVYVQGFNGVDYEATGFKELPESFDKWDGESRDEKGRPLVEWQKLPRGSVVMLDECYDYLPSRSSGSKVPPHVDALARHRHYDIELIFLSQKHDQIDFFVKGLIGEHIHVRNKFGFQAAVLKTWDCFESNVKGSPLTSKTWWYPKANYKLYKSAVSHSVKKKLPWYYYAFMVLLPLVGYGFWRMSHPQLPPGVQGEQVQLGQRGREVGDKVDDALRRRDFVTWLQPRVPGLPWTAPAWDNLQPQGVPDLWCMAVEDGRCSCMTEQGTKYKVELNVCRTIAREGVYNPFRKPVDDRGQGRGRDDRAVREERPGRSEGAVAGIPAPTGYWPKATIPQSYSPPQHQIATDGRYQ